MKKLNTPVLFTAIAFVFVWLSFHVARGQPVVVRAILFYSPSCPHCHLVMTEVLPPLERKYGQKFEVIEINVDAGEGLDLYRAAVQHFAVPEDRIGVPALFVGKTHLVGSREIPDQLPGLIEAGLDAGGIELPDFPGLTAYLANQQPVEPLGPGEKFAQDPLANSLAVLVFLFMLFSLVWNTACFYLHRGDRCVHWPDWVLPTLAVAGMLIASYLSYVELTQVEAVCGPVGNCNAVQASSYARLFGFLPVGIIGVLGYLALLLAWLAIRLLKPATQMYVAFTLWGFAWIGVAFMMYLTFLEPFVIGATCAWCLTSALIMTTILWASTGPAIVAWGNRKALKSPLIHPI